MFSIIESANANIPNGHYSQAIEANGFIFTSILLGVTQDNNETDFEQQLKIIFVNIEKILIEKGSGLGKVIKLNIYLTDIDDWSKANEIVAMYFKEHKPARGILSVPQLHLKAKVAAEVIAIK